MKIVLDRKEIAEAIEAHIKKKLMFDIDMTYSITVTQAKQASATVEIVSTLTEDDNDEEHS